MEKTGYFVLVSVYLAAAAFFDQRTGKVPNRLIVAGLALGGARVFLPAPGGALLSLRSAAAGIALPFFLLFPFFCLRLMGAGDIKLLMAAGACGGPDVVLRCMLIAFAAAGLYGVIRHLWWKGAAQAGTRLQIRLAVFVLAGWVCVHVLRAVPGLPSCIRALAGGGI